MIFAKGKNNSGEKRKRERERDVFLFTKEKVGERNVTKDLWKVCAKNGEREGMVVEGTRRPREHRTDERNHEVLRCSKI